MPTGAVIGAAGIGSALIGSSAAKSAAKTEAGAARDAAALQQQMFQQTREDLSPYRDFGASALPAYAKLLGLDSSGNPTTATAPKVGDPNIGAWLAANPDVAEYYNKTPSAQTVPLEAFAADVARQQSSIRAPVPTYNAQTVQDYRNPQEQALEQTPGYQFARDQGIQQTQRTLGSRGLTGAQAKGIARFVTGLADQTYGEQVGRLGAAVGVGQNSAAQTGQIGANYAGTIGNNIVGAGQATAAGQVGSANAISGGLSSLGNYAYANRILGMYGSSAQNVPWGVSSGSASDVAGLY